MTNTEKALNFYKSAFLNNRPDWVPARIRLPNYVRSDLPFDQTIAQAGEYDCESNQWGALSIATSDGKRLGIKPPEFEVLAWTENRKAAP